MRNLKKPTIILLAQINSLIDKMNYIIIVLFDRGSDGTIATNIENLYSGGGRRVEQGTFLVRDVILGADDRAQLQWSKLYTYCSITAKAD